MTGDDSTSIMQLLHRKGYRLTPQRRLVLEAIRQSGGHISLPEIYRYVVERAPGVDRATIYRCLDFLCELRLVVAANLGANRWVYELAGEPPHHHLVCRTCGQLEQISHTEVAKFFESIQENHQYLIDMQHLVLFGLCQRCQNPDKEEVDE